MKSRGLAPGLSIQDDTNTKSRQSMKMELSSALEAKKDTFQKNMTRNKIRRLLSVFNKLDTVI